MKYKMMSLYVIFAMVLMAFAGSFTAAAEEEAVQEPGSRLLTTPDGLSWADPLKITSNNVDDAYPTLVVDSNANAHILYYQSDSDFKYQKIQRPGKLVVKEQHIVSAAMTFQHNFWGGQGQPTERIGIDGDENVHLVWATGQWGSNQYQKFTNAGKPLSQVIDPSPSAQSPQLPYMGVGMNNMAYIATEQEGGGEHAELTRIDKSFNTMMVDVKSSSEGVALVVDSWNKDDVHYWCKSWSGSGVFHSKWSATLTQLVAPHSVLESLSSGGSQGPLPMSTTTPNANVHVLVGDQAAAPRALYYAELDKNGNVITDLISVTPSAADFGDIVGDGENNVYVIWGDTGDSSVHYIKILEGKEKQSIEGKENNIKISQGLSGISSWPQFGVDTDNGLHVVFLNNGDGDNEVYYRYAYTFGVELGMNPEEIAKMMFIHPAEVKSANLTVKNVGGQNDTMFLNISIDYNGHEADGWDAWLDEDEIELEPSAKDKTLVYVRGPDRGNPNDFIEICVNASSMRNPDKNDSVCFRSFLIVDHGVKIEIPDNVHVTMAGDATEFDVTVTNTGDTDEDIRVVITDQPYDWEVLLSEETFTQMKPKEVRQLKLSITPPASSVADEVGSVTLKAFEMTKPNVKDTATAHAIVQPNIFIQIGCEEPEKSVKPGNSTDYTIWIKNEGNVGGTVVIILEIISGIGDWNVILERTSIGVRMKEEKEVVMTVFAPENARAGSRLVVRVEGSDEARTMSAEVTTTTIVEAVHKLEATVSPSNEVHVDPGKSAKYTAVVRNLGNGPEKVQLLPKELPANWDMQYMKLDVSGEMSAITEVMLEPGETAEFLVILSVPSNALAGSYNSFGVLRTEDGTYSQEFMVKTRVKEVFNIDVTSKMTKLVGTPGKKVLFTILLANNGNADDSITMKIPSGEKPSDWESWFYVMDSEDTGQGNERELGDEDTVDLHPGERTNVKLVLNIPKTAEYNEEGYRVRVVGTSKGNIEDDVLFLVNIELPNLIIKDVDFDPPNVKARQPVAIKVTIYNEGTVQTDNVNISFYDKDNLADKVELEVVAPGRDGTVVFTWMPTPGQHNLKFVVDSDDNIVEFNEQDNTMSVKKSVQDDNALVPGFDGAWLIVSGVLATLAVAVGRRRR